MKKTFLIILIALSESLIACGSTEFHFNRYWSLDSVDAKATFLDNTYNTTPINYRPETADPVITKVLVDALTTGVETSRVKHIMQEYHCAYAAHRTDEYAKLISLLGTENYNHHCPSSLRDSLYIVQASGVNVRKAPTTESKILGTVVQNNALFVIEEFGQWVKVKSYAGDGYVYKALLKKY